MSACKLMLPEPPWAEIEKSGRFKLVLSTPGLFAKGWLPPSLGEAREAGIWSHRGLSARLVAACLGRPDVVSGWDMATDRPKPALRSVPVGAVYWFEGFQGDITGLKRLMEAGLWGNELGDMHPQRKAEGFNNVIVAAWH